MDIPNCFNSSNDISRNDFSKINVAMLKSLYEHIVFIGENNIANIGDFVSVKECKPFSKTKTWILEESDSGGGNS